MAKSVQPEKSLWRTLWASIVEDRDLVFFGLSFLTWLVAYLSNPENVAVGVVGGGSFLVGILFYFQKHRALARQLTGIKHIPVVCVVGKTDSEAQRTFDLAKESICSVTGFRSFDVMEKFFRIKLSLGHSERPLPPERAAWEEFIRRVQERIDCLAETLYGTKVYHVFIQGPSSLALGLGAVFGCKHPLIAYQWSAGVYKPVLDLREDPRGKIRGSMSGDYRYIEVAPNAFEGLTTDTAVVLEMAGHSPLGTVQSYIRDTLKSNWKIVAVGNTFGGTLEEDDWAPVVQELNSILVRLHSTPEVQRIHLFHSMPVALAFGLGMALGTVTPVIVYNWEARESTYYPVLELNKLESRL